MIELTPLARPYAKALFESSIESNSIDEMADELQTMAAAAKTEGVINTIENPVLSRKEIVDILIKLFEESVSETSKKLLELLAENKRLNLLEKHKEQNSIEVFVAVKPGDEARANIEEKLKSTYGKDANIFFTKDPK